MLLIGLTGSIATGKSTVSLLLSSPPYNLPLIDADLLARRVVEPGTTGYHKIVTYFSPTTPDLILPASEVGENGPDGKGRPLNRPALGRRVFGNTLERQKDRAILNKIVHPAVRWEMYKSLLKSYFRGYQAVVLDVPLLFEAGMDLLCGTVMVVAVSDPEIQMKRLRDRDPHLTEEDARNRVASQWDVRDKARRAEMRGEGAGVVVWNDGDKDDLKRELEKIMMKIQQKNPKWWSWLLLIVPPFGGLAAMYQFLRSWLMARRWKDMKAKERSKL
ncbi:MAG: hypothetical protein M1834_005026 [Cirrosporium novae-zelandiae]|nr:MAG: hypothetical protein M1834_005026 [Cirrosporium novae-zelandiae]